MLHDATFSAAHRGGGAVERDRETERQRDRERDRQRERQTERETERETDREIDRERDRERERDRPELRAGVRTMSARKHFADVKVRLLRFGPVRSRGKKGV